ncbi:MAG: diadenylate cyclase CdaA [Phycisphaerae bacterium]|nr:diadenylate cyclase CdaA [Phycisphaerae bacterium]
MGIFQSIYRYLEGYLHRLSSYTPWVVVIEMLLIGLVVWWVIRFLRGTRGARLVKGAALLLVTLHVGVQLLPKSYGFERIQFLYGHFLVVAFAALIVAFQPELRRALIQIGQTSLFRTVRGELEAMIDSLVDSAAFLSRNKIGAVMAIERSVGLATLSATGTTIDGRVTSSLLNTIFYPGSPLHDMGVIIRNSRVAAAGCQFPLAESEEVDASLGSRHRAALGLSQDTDAVVLVISEETGRVSIAVEGQLYVGLELDGLREMLTGLLKPGPLLPRRSRRDEELSPELPESREVP